MPEASRSVAVSSSLVRIETLAARAWRLKLYSARDEFDSRSERLGAVRRSFRAGIADVQSGPIAGFAVARLPQAGECSTIGGGLVLTSYWWEGELLHRSVLTLPSSGPPMRSPHTALTASEVRLAAAECETWHRLVLHASRPDLDAYIGHDCA